MSTAPLNPESTPGESEYSWGPGLVPKACENEPPSKGGRYRPIAPPVTESGHEARRG